MKELRVFIDTNVWFSAFWNEGTCAQLLQVLRTSPYELVLSQLVLEELMRNSKKKMPNLLPFIIDYLDTTKPTVLKNPQREEARLYIGLARLDDLSILVSAIQYHCRYFITGNIKDFQVESIKKKTKLNIMTPALFLSELEVIS
ncbi:MAG: PIN domain-containing protein [Patescibacteria group bacterium]